MKDRCCIDLCEKILACQSLKVLNLSHNLLTDKSTQAICQVIYHCSNLKSLFLHYNKYTAKGGAQIAKYLEANRSI